MPSNAAAWLDGPKTPLNVRVAPYTAPGENEIVIKNAALAINPVDYLKQELGRMVYSWIKYPFVIGTDIAGEVVGVGPDVTRFKTGDRVVSLAIGTMEEYNTSAKGAFQQYTVALAHMTSPIPSNVSYEMASVLPLGLSTAACSLFQQDHLGLDYPSSSSSSASPKKTLLVWGGSTSVGSNAIQLAVAAGYEVITTASPKNFDKVRKLGASQVFDYNSKTVVSDVIRAFKDKKIAGAISIGQGSAEACLDILHECEGDRILSMATFPTPPKPPKSFVLLRTVLHVASRLLTNSFTAWSRGIRTKFIFGYSLVTNGVGQMIFEEFLPEALAEGRYVTAPEPYVVGNGLEDIQRGFDTLKSGVSAKKVVITL
ncbi:MAG: hypothetical protein Q9165_008194 [Trypethelium subeluteriae]